MYATDTKRSTYVSLETSGNLQEKGSQLYIWKLNGGRDTRFFRQCILVFLVLQLHEDSVI